MLLYWILLPIVWVLAHIIWRFEVIGRENLRTVRDGRAYVIAPNHIANLDPVLSLLRCLTGNDCVFWPRRSCLKSAGRLVSALHGRGCH